MKAESVMKKDIITVPMGMTLSEVANVLFEKDISGVLVVDENRHLKGLVSEKDIYRKLYPSFDQFYVNMEKPIDFEKMESRAENVKNMKVEEFMIKDMHTVSVDEPLMKVGGIMLARKVNRLPVLDHEGNLVGIISRRDIYKAIFRKEFGG